MRYIPMQLREGVLSGYLSDAKLINILTPNPSPSPSRGLTLPHLRGVSLLC